MCPRTAESTRVITARPRLWHRLTEIWRYRELLVGLVRTELKVKYKNSALGFVWSMLNPALYLVVFYIVFQIVLGSGIPFFAIYLLCGLLVWNFFSTALTGATGSVVANGPLVKKIYFPREILALAAVGASLVHFFLQGIVLVLALGLFRYEVAPSYCLLIIPALVVLLLFTASLGVLLASINVYVRDAQHLLELLMLAWFWLTPIVYQYRLIADKVSDAGWSTGFLLLNPLTSVVLVFQRAIYNRVDAVNDGTVLPILPAGAGHAWYLRNLLLVGAASLLLGWLALVVFRRLEANFAEEL